MFQIQLFRNTDERKAKIHCGTGASPEVWWDFGSPWQQRNLHALHGPSLSRQYIFNLIAVCSVSARGGPNY